MNLVPLKRYKYWHLSVQRYRKFLWYHWSIKRLFSGTGGTFFTIDFRNRNRKSKLTQTEIYRIFSHSQYNKFYLDDSLYSNAKEKSNFGGCSSNSKNCLRMLFCVGKVVKVVLCLKQFLVSFQLIVPRIQKCVLMYFTKEGWWDWYLSW